MKNSNKTNNYSLNGNGNYNGNLNGNESYISYPNDTSIYPYEDDNKDYNNNLNTGFGEEEVYCICKKTLEEEMIECENKSCKFKWFHFSCVGIDVAPEGDWYCADCLKSRQKKKKR